MVLCTDEVGVIVEEDEVFVLEEEDEGVEVVYPGPAVKVTGERTKSVGPRVAVKVDEPVSEASLRVT